MAETPVEQNNKNIPSLAVVLDFDGTVTTRDVGDAIVRKFGLPGFDALEEGFRRGEVRIRELWIHEIAHLPGDRYNDMREFALKTAVMRPGLQDLVDYCHERRIPIEIASNGIKFYVEAALEANGIRHLPFRCLGADFSNSGSSRLAFPADIELCARNGLCKCSRIWRLQKAGKKVIFVGDGASDACAALEPEILMARSSLAKLAEKNCWPYEPFEDFHDVIRLLKELRGEEQTRRRDRTAL